MKLIFFSLSNVIQTLSTQQEFLEQLDTTTNGTNENVNRIFLLEMKKIIKFGLFF